MKKNLLLFCGIASAALASAQCSELFISEYISGAGENKAIEIYNPTNATITLTGNYRITLWDNGTVTPSVSRPLIGTIASGQTFVLCNGQVTADSVHPATGSPYSTPACDTNLQKTALAKYGNNGMLDTAHFYAVSYHNGDDAISLDKLTSGSYVPVDIFACIGEWPLTGTAHVGWWSGGPNYNAAPTGKSSTKYNTLRRKRTVKQGVTVNPAPNTFNTALQWDSLGEKTGGTIPNYPTGSHVCDCITGIQEFTDNVFVNVFPNPANAGIIYIIAAKPIELVQIYNLVGELVFAEKINGSASSISLNLSSIAKGAYLVKSSFDNSHAHVSKLIIQ